MADKAINGFSYLDPSLIGNPDGQAMRSEALAQLIRHEMNNTLAGMQHAGWDEAINSQLLACTASPDTLAREWKIMTHADLKIEATGATAEELRPYQFNGDPKPDGLAKETVAAYNQAQSAKDQSLTMDASST